MCFWPLCQLKSSLSDSWSLFSLPNQKSRASELFGATADSRNVAIIMAANQALAFQGARAPLGTFTEARPHPSLGGNPYSDDFRLDVITRYQLGLPLESPTLEQLRNQTPPAYPSFQTCERYVTRFRTWGHFRPMKATGNHEARSEVRGGVLVRLALYRTVNPTANIDYVRAFLFNMDPTVPPYSPAAIVHAEQLLGLSRKRSSTTCSRAYWRVNLHKRDLFWNENYPLGRADVLTRDMIDMDECGLKIEATNPRYGKSVTWERCHTDGSYNRDKKLNLIMAISADPALDMEWHDMWPQEEGGTDLYRVYVFFDRVIQWLNQHHPGRSFCFTMDNLNTHKDPIITNLITNSGHRYLYRAPYWSVDGPMEYVFNTLHVHLLDYFREVDNLMELENVINTIIANDMTDFLLYFLHVGFPNT